MFSRIGVELLAPRLLCPHFGAPVFRATRSRAPRDGESSVGERHRQRHDLHDAGREIALLGAVLRQRDDLERRARRIRSAHGEREILSCKGAVR